MKETVCIRGIPEGLALDAWWFDAPLAGENGRKIPDNTGARAGEDGRHKHNAWGRLLILGLSSVWLFWGHMPGVSLVVFAAILFLLSSWKLSANKAVPRSLVVLAIASVPVLEHVQSLSVVILTLGVVMACLCVRHPDQSAFRLLVGAVETISGLPHRWMAQVQVNAIVRSMKMQTPPKFGQEGPSRIVRLLSDWGFPLGGGLITIALLLRANPVASDYASNFFDVAELLPRVLFGAGVAFLCAPFLRRDLPRRTMTGFPQSVQLPWLGINSRSVLRALVTFNLIIVLQTLTDPSIVVLGAALPDGMTLAEYAHRGAYPLLATALLAAGFALVAQPYLSAHRLIQPLMIIYIAQNVVLCVAALARLDLYVQEFGLTYLRVHALIWMALVAVGLSVMLWQVVARKSRKWLIGRAAILGGLTLYLCCLINFAGLIAGYNLTRNTQDHQYICDLGANAFSAALAAGKGNVIQNTQTDQIVGVRLDGCTIYRNSLLSWQEWGYRKWRTAHILPPVQNDSLMGGKT